jgi:hypothetical protein
MMDALRMAGLRAKVHPSYDVAAIAIREWLEEDPCAQ